MPDEQIELREVTQDNVAEVVGLRVKPGQEGIVATNSNSLAEAYVSNGRAWPRAVYADGVAVGFLMLDLTAPDQAAGVRGACWVWRLMVDAEHQGKGYGSEAMRLAMAHVQSLTFIDEILLTYKPHVPNLGAFYSSLGFEPTGAVDEDGEVVMRFAL